MKVYFNVTVISLMSLKHQELSHGPTGPPCSELLDGPMHMHVQRGRGWCLQCSCSKYPLHLFGCKRELGGIQRGGLGKLFLTMPEEVASRESVLSLKHALTQCTCGKNQTQVAALSSQCVAQAPHRLQVSVQVNLTETSSLHKIPPWGNCSSSSVPANYLCYGKMNFDEIACLKNE